MPNLHNTQHLREYMDLTEYANERELCCCLPLTSKEMLKG